MAIHPGVPAVAEFSGEIDICGAAWLRETLRLTIGRHGPAMPQVRSHFGDGCKTVGSTSRIPIPVAQRSMHFQMAGAGSTKYYYNWGFSGHWIAEDGTALPTRIASYIPDSIISKALSYFGVDAPGAISGAPVEGEDEP